MSQNDKETFQPEQMPRLLLYFLKGKSMSEFVVTGPLELTRFLSWSIDPRNGIYQEDKRIGQRLTREQAVFMILCYLKKGLQGSAARIEFRSYENKGYNKYKLVMLPEDEGTPYLEINCRKTVDLSFLRVYAKVKIH